MLLSDFLSIFNKPFNFTKEETRPEISEVDHKWKKNFLKDILSTNISYHFFCLIKSLVKKGGGKGDWKNIFRREGRPGVYKKPS